MTANSNTQVRQLAESLTQLQLKVCTAESCTGGLIAKSFTDLAGSSSWFDRGFVTYSNAAKTEMLKVPASVIERYGAVSESVANAMVQGALTHSDADLSVAVTGVAGPDGGSAEKPVGTVWIAFAGKDVLIAKRYLFKGDRDAIRQASLQAALTGLLDLIESSWPPQAK